MKTEELSSTSATLRGMQLRTRFFFLLLRIFDDLHVSVPSHENFKHEPNFCPVLEMIFQCNRRCHGASAPRGSLRRTPDLRPAGVSHRCRTHHLWLYLAHSGVCLVPNLRVAWTLCTIPRAAHTIVLVIFTPLLFSTGSEVML